MDKTPVTQENVTTVPCEVYSRVVGYLRPTSAWNDGKRQEFADRIYFSLGADVVSSGIDAKEPSRDLGSTPSASTSEARVSDSPLYAGAAVTGDAAPAEECECS